MIMAVLRLFQFVCFVFITCFSLIQASEQTPAPHELTEFSDILGALYHGALLRLQVKDVTSCDNRLPAQIKGYNFYLNVEDVEGTSHGRHGKYGMVVTAVERYVNGTRYGLKGPATRQIQVRLLSVGIAILEVADFDPVTFDLLASGTLECAYRNDTVRKLNVGLSIWQTQNQASEMGTMDRLNSAVGQGHMMTYVLDLGKMKPPMLQTRLAGGVKNFRRNKNKDIAFSTSFVQGSILRTIQVKVSQAGNITVQRVSFDRKTATYLSIMQSEGKFGGDGALEMYWKNLS